MQRKFTFLNCFRNSDHRYCSSLKSGIFFAIFCNFCFQGSMRNDRLQ